MRVGIGLRLLDQLERPYYTASHRGGVQTEAWRHHLQPRRHHAVPARELARLLREDVCQGQGMLVKAALVVLRVLLVVRGRLRDLRRQPQVELGVRVMEVRRMPWACRQYLQPHNHQTVPARERRQLHLPSHHRTAPAGEGRVCSRTRRGGGGERL